jgi:hypothetical protein
MIITGWLSTGNPDVVIKIPFLSFSVRKKFYMPLFGGAFLIFKIELKS